MKAGIHHSRILGLVCTLAAGPLVCAQEQPGSPSPATMRQSLSVEISGPEALALGSANRFRVVVRNDGQASLGPIEVATRLPRHLDAKRAAPLPTLRDSVLTWTIDSIDARSSKTLIFEAVVRSAEPVAIEATLRAASTTVLRRDVAAPKIELSVIGAARSIVGTSIPVEVQLHNPGPSEITNGGLKVFHSEGIELSRSNDQPGRAFRLTPGETMTVRLTLNARKRGHQGVIVEVEADGGLVAKEERKMQVVGPELDVEIAGPQRTTPSQPGHYTVSVTNLGDGPAAKAMAFLELPAGYDFLKAAEGGTFDATRRTIVWRVGSILPGYEVKLHASLRPTRLGMAELRGSAKDAWGSQDDSYHTTLVAAAAE